MAYTETQLWEIAEGSRLHSSTRGTLALFAFWIAINSHSGGVNIGVFTSSSVPQRWAAISTTVSRRFATSLGTNAKSEIYGMP